MNIYLISQDQNSGYDTYDSAVVAAISVREAKRILPGCSRINWADDTNQVTVTLLGKAKSGTKSGEVFCASFNAG